MWFHAHLWNWKLALAIHPRVHIHELHRFRFGCGPYSRWVTVGGASMLLVTRQFGKRRGDKRPLTVWVIAEDVLFGGMWCIYDKWSCSLFTARWQRNNYARQWLSSGFIVLISLCDCVSVCNVVRRIRSSFCQVASQLWCLAMLAMLAVIAWIILTHCT